MLTPILDINFSCAYNLSERSNANSSLHNGLAEVSEHVERHTSANGGVGHNSQVPSLQGLCTAPEWGPSHHRSNLAQFTVAGVIRQCCKMGQAQTEVPLNLINHEFLLLRQPLP